MAGVAIHDDVFGELVEWYEDVAGSVDRPSIGARCMVVPVRHGWGRTTLLERLASQVNGDDTLSIARLVRGGDAPEGMALQAAWLPGELRDASGSSAGDVLGVSSSAGRFQRGLSAADAFGVLGGRVGSVAALLVSLGVDVFGSVESREDARALGDVGRLARRVAGFSADEYPVVEVVDDPELLDARLLVRFVPWLIEPVASRVLVVAACDPQAPVFAELLRREARGLAADRTRWMDVDNRMDAEHRAALARTLARFWPDAAVARLTSRTTSFAQVFTVLGARAADDVLGSVDAAVAVDAVLDSVLPRSMSTEASLVAWLGGIIHTRAYQCCVRRSRWTRLVLWPMLPCPARSCGSPTMCERAEGRQSLRGCSRRRIAGRCTVASPGSLLILCRRLRTRLSGWRSCVRCGCWSGGVISCSM